MKILVTGGAGYIGSHIVLTLLSQNFEVAVFDNLSYGHKEALDIVEHISKKKISFFKGDLTHKKEIRNCIQLFQPEVVMHFASFIAVGESVIDPLKYYNNNLTGGINLLEALKKYKVRYFVFSSTAGIFGQPEEIPVSETTVKNPINPYGRSKYMFEQILEDTAQAYDFYYVTLRYFNAAGADLEGRIGEDHNPETHLIPITMEAALGKRPFLAINGDDYKTKDGTCIKDYIHVLDLADAHIKAISYLEKNKKSDVFNLGTAHGYSNKEVVDTVKRITQKKFPVQIAKRRPGDAPILIADNKKAQDVLGWKVRYNLDDIIKSAWIWETNKGSYRY